MVKKLHVFSMKEIVIYPTRAELSVSSQESAKGKSSSEFRQRKHKNVYSTAELRVRHIIGIKLVFGAKDGALPAHSDKATTL